MNNIKTIALLLVIMIANSCFAQINTWRDLYKVKKKDTLYGIAAMYDLTVDELKSANPEMAAEGYVLKKGDTVFIPFSKNHQPEVKTTPEEPALKPVVVKKAGPKNLIRVGVMLPLHDVDGDGRRMIEYYRGLLLACDSLRKTGIATDIHAWNIAIDTDIRQALLEQDAQNCDIIFGPLYTKQVNALATFCDTYQIKMVIPFSIMGEDVAHHSSIFQVYQPQNEIDKTAVSAFFERFGSDHPVFIDCNDSTSNKGPFTKALRQQLEAKGIAYNITNLNSTLEQFQKAFDPAQHNIVVLNSGKGKAMTAAFNKIAQLQKEQPEITVSIFGYNEWLVYERQQKKNFFTYDMYLPTTFYYNPLSGKTQQLEKDYRRWFNKSMQNRQPRFALTGFDHGIFFLKGLHQYGSSFSGDKSQNLSRPIQTPLRFESVGTTGGYKNNTFQLIHYTNTGKIQIINY